MDQEVTADPINVPESSTHLPPPISQIVTTLSVDLV